MSGTLAIVLAAGKGTRMESELPKVLVPVNGRPMIEYVLETLNDCGVDHVAVVVGYRQDLVRQRLADRSNVTFVEQTEQLGTGHAVMVCKDVLQAHDGPVLILAGDTPTIQRETISRLLAEFTQSRPACLLGTARKDNPHGLGRIVRNEQGEFIGIVEEKDATDVQRRITEVNMSCYVFQSQDLQWSLERLDSNNQQGEYYLTDCPAKLLAEGRKVQALEVLTPIETLSINNMSELALVEEAMAAAQ